MDKEQQIEEIAGTICNTCKEMIAVSEKCKNSVETCLAADAHAERLYAAGYRKIDENCAVITKDDLKLYQKQDVKEFADKLKAKTLDETYRNKDFNIHISDIYKMIEETLKEYE